MKKVYKIGIGYVFLHVVGCFVLYMLLESSEFVVPGADVDLKEISIPAWLAISVVATLISIIFSFMGEDSGVYMTWHKSCSNCNQKVSDYAKKGDICPHCGVRWSADKSFWTNLPGTPKR